MVTDLWDPAAVGVLSLPSRRLIRGRGLGRPLPDGPPPAFALYLFDNEPPSVAWESRWLHWPDFGLPADRANTEQALREVLARAGAERVEVACLGGNGRTGTALACIAVLDGVPGRDAVAYVREHYRATAVETPEQYEFVAHFGLGSKNLPRLAGAFDLT